MVWNRAWLTSDHHKFLLRYCKNTDPMFITVTCSIKFPMYWRQLCEKIQSVPLLFVILIRAPLLSHWGCYRSRIAYVSFLCKFSCSCKKEVATTAGGQPCSCYQVRFISITGDILKNFNKGSYSKKRYEMFPMTMRGYSRNLLKTGLWFFNWNQQLIERYWINYKLKQALTNIIYQIWINSTVYHYLKNSFEYKPLNLIRYDLEVYKWDAFWSKFVQKYSHKFNV